MKIKIFLASMILSVAMLSCKVAFVPTYDSGVYAEIKLGQSLTKKLYDQAIENPDKSYAASDSLYRMLGAEIASIVSKESARPKSRLLVGIANNIQIAFNKYRNDHLVKGKLNNTELKLYNQYLQAHFKSLENAEKNLPK
jgi:hypothetical protein